MPTEREQPVKTPPPRPGCRSPRYPAGAAFAVPSKIYSIMAAGRPFVCTAEPGSPLDQLRADSDAFVTCPPDQFADAIERLIAPSAPDSDAMAAPM